jgi:hypothetical protein
MYVLFAIWLIIDWYEVLMMKFSYLTMILNLIYLTWFILIIYSNKKISAKHKLVGRLGGTKRVEKIKRQLMQV